MFKKNSIMHVCHQVDECVPYEKIASQMKELNNEQRIIMDEFYTRKKKIQQNHYMFF